MTKPRYAMTHCCVPFCPRSSTVMNPAHEWLCRDHWRLVDRRLKAVRTRVIRRWKRRGQWTQSRIVQIDRFLDGWWRRAKRQALERATGVSA